MVFDASSRPHRMANSVNKCMHTGPLLQPLLVGHIDQIQNVNPLIACRSATGILRNWLEGGR